jgi:putative endonuclease
MAESARAKGVAAEGEACSFLTANGFEILHRNYYCKGGEIDIVAKKDATVHFVEVKSGKSFEPSYAVTAQKLAKIKQCIEVYLGRFGVEEAWCISAVFIRSDGIELLENITL